MQDGALGAQVFCDGPSPELCYQIIGFPDLEAVYLHHKGPLAGGGPVVVFRNLADKGGEKIKFTFQNYTEKLAGALLKTESKCVFCSASLLCTSHAHYHIL